MSDSRESQDRFVGEVARILRGQDDRQAQDQIDVFLHGGTVPPVWLPRPDPECRDCRGEGRVCPCHLIQASFGCRQYGPSIVCPCVKSRAPIVDAEAPHPEPMVTADTVVIERTLGPHIGSDARGGQS